MFTKIFYKIFMFKTHMHNVDLYIDMQGIRINKIYFNTDLCCHFFLIITMCSLYHKYIKPYYKHSS